MKFLNINLNLNLFRSHLAVIGFLTVLTGLVYTQTFRNEFVYDDKLLIQENKLFQRVETIPQLFITDWWHGVEEELGREPGTTRDRRYRPFAAMTYVLNYVITGPQPLGYHLTNLLFHTAASAVLYLIALRLGWSARSAILAAVLFVIHPLHTEAVAWIVGRPELMMALFVLGSLWAELQGHRWTALLLFGFGLLSKEQAVVMPALLLLMDVTCPAGRYPDPFSSRVQGFTGISFSYAARRYLPYLIVLLLYLGVRIAIMGGIQPPIYMFVVNPLEHIQGLTWALSVLKFAGHYLWLVMWPATLAADYSYNAIPLAGGWMDLGVLWGMWAWGALFLLAVWAWNRDRRVSFAVGLTLLAFAPVSNVAISVGTPIAERLFYLPLAGLCLLAGLGYEALRNGLPSRLASHASVVAVVVICMALAFRTVVRLQDWQSTESLFESTVSAFPENAKAHAMLADHLRRKLDKQERIRAIGEFRKAIDLYADYPIADYGFATNFGHLLLDFGYSDEALMAMKMAAQRAPNASRSYFNLGLVYVNLGQFDEAEKVWRYGLAMNPNDSHLHSSLSRLLIEKGRFAEALGFAEAALSKDPKFVLAAYNRALALQMLGRVNEAIAAYEHVLAMPDAPEQAKLDVSRKLATLRGQAQPPVGAPVSRQCQPGMLGC
jgi:tetratricopeptide (TPR) repeat protein